MYHSKHFYKSIFFIIISFLFISCGGGGSSSSTQFTDNEKKFLDNAFKTSYYWYEQINSKDYSNYSDPNEMITEYRYSEFDKWSYAETFESYQKRSTQVTSGLGCSYQYKNNDGVITRTIYKVRFESPCAKAGFKRGDKYIKLNGEIFDYSKYLVAIKKLGVESTFTVNRNGTLIDIKIVPNEYKYKTSKYSIIKSSDDKKIGYFIYDSFTSLSTVEIDEAFTYFKVNLIDDLIIDLRYNGGGSLNTASYLLDKLAGLNYNGKLQYKRVYYTYDTEKKENVQKNETENFLSSNNSLDLSKVYFLTTSRTASASEMVINSLKPYIDVKLFGGTTSGKPVGMRAQYLDRSSYWYWLINLSMYNANGVGEYFDGLSVDCEATDEYIYSRDNINDNLLNKALYHIKNDSCSTGETVSTDDFSFLN